MEDLLEQKDIPFSRELLNVIRDHSRTSLQEETCGLIVEEQDNYKFLACENLSENPSHHFKINPKIFIENKVLYIYHSHVNCSANPSNLDILYSDELCIPFLIYSIRDDEFKIYKNISV